MFFYSEPSTLADLLLETFENPNWNDTFNISSYSVPSFTNFALLAENFETGIDW